MPDVEPVLFHGSFLTGDGYARHAADAFMRFQLRRPFVWIQIAVPLVVIPLLSLVLDKYAWIFLVALGVDALIIVANVISWRSKRQSIADRIAASTTVGSVRQIDMTESTVSLRSGESFSQTPYRQFESADTEGDFVFLRVRGSSTRSIVPREMFTEESLAFLQSKIAG